MFAAAALLLAAVPAVPAPAEDAGDLLLLQSVEERVASIGYRLAVSAGDLCPDQVALAGIQVHDASQYDLGIDDALREAFGGGPWPKVLALAKDGAAARAGLEPNDSILSVDGMAPPPAPARPSYQRVAGTLALIERAFADDGRARFALQRAGMPVTVEVVADRGCASRFQLKLSRGMQGKADGAYVEITSGLVAFTADDAELAAAMAHELAHNILGHRARLDAEGVHRGILQNFGRSARITRETEVEADRMSVHLLDRAGYPMRASLSFWERFRKAESSFGDQTHPGGKRRIAILTAEIERIEAAKRRGEAPRFEP